MIVGEPLTLWCIKCWAGYASIGDIPAVCPGCDQETRWTTRVPVASPRVPYRLTRDDVRFLTTVGIKPDV